MSGLDLTVASVNVRKSNRDALGSGSHIHTDWVMGFHHPLVLPCKGGSTNGNREIVGYL